MSGKKFRSPDLGPFGPSYQELRGSTAGKTLALQAADLGSSPSTIYGSQALLGVNTEPGEISEHI